MASALAVSESAQAPNNMALERGQQQAHADQGRKGDGKPHSGLCECRGLCRNKDRRCNLGRRHDEDLNELGGFWKMVEGAIQLCRSATLCVRFRR